MVEYASGHRTEAQHVGQTLGIGEVMPMEGAVASVVNGTSVVVIAGADKESLVGSGNGEASSEGAAGGSPGAGEAQGNEAPAASETPAGEASAGSGRPPDPAPRVRMSPESPTTSFLKLPERSRKPRERGLTHVLDRGLSGAEVEGMLEVAGRTWTSSSWAGARRW